MSESGIKRFEINLEHDIDEQYQYEPGQVLRGNITLTLSESVKVKNIQVHIKGEASVSWDEDENTNKHEAFRAYEMYVDKTQELLQSLPGESIVMDKGKHKFPMEYKLPDSLPSSFIGKYGSITYVVKATLKEDAKFGLSTMITSEPFLVLRSLDISREEDILKEYKIQFEKRLWGALAFCLSGKVIADLKMNKRGHLPGEDIFMDAEISNSSPRVVKAVQASLIMHSTFHAKNTKRQNTQIVSKKRDEWEMEYGEGRRWKNVRLTIPPYIPESRLDGCDIIDINYELVFRVEISGDYELKTTVPITIGTTQSGEKNRNRFVKRGGQEAVQKLDKKGNPVASEDDIELEADEDFRYPMDPGDTRQNPLFNIPGQDN